MTRFDKEIRKLGFRLEQDLSIFRRMISTASERTPNSLSIACTIMDWVSSNSSLHEISAMKQYMKTFKRGDRQCTK